MILLSLGGKMLPDITLLSPRRILEDVLPEMAWNNPDLIKAAGAIMAIELIGEGGGIWSIDPSGDPIVSEGVHGGAACLIKMEASYFKELLRSRGTEPWVTAFVQNRISVAGDLSIALRLGRAFASELG